MALDSLEFTWTNVSAIAHERAVRGIAVGALFFAVASWVAMLSTTILAMVVIAVGLLAVAIAVRSTPPTIIEIRGDSLVVGQSHVINIRELRSVRFARVWFEEYFVVEGKRGRGSVPLNGVPNHIREQLLLALQARISTI